MHIQTSFLGTLSDFFHIISVGLVFVLIFGGWAFHWRIVREKDPQLRSYVSRWSSTIGFLWPFVAICLLVTGIGDIYYRSSGTGLHWYDEGWLVAKLIFFVILVVNGSVFGSILGRKRTQLLQFMNEQQSPEIAEPTLKSLNRQFSWHYLVQFLLLAIIIFLSTIGSGKQFGIS